jgi:branched-chain amino acid aminotransferase
MELISQKNINIRLQALAKDELRSIDAAFLTGTSSRILAIKEIDGTGLNTQHALITDLKQSLLKCIDSYKKTTK